VPVGEDRGAVATLLAPSSAAAPERGGPTGDTQQQVADRAGLSRPPVYEMETGSTAYRVDSLIQLCHAHGVDLAKVLGPP
jgi:hypothetical protein